jgi:hypothetical protein
MWLVIHWSIQLSTDIIIVMHTVIHLVLPSYSTQIHKTVYRHSHCHAHYHAISVSNTRHWSIKTVYRHSHCHAHCHVISASEFRHWFKQLSTEVHIVMHTVMRLVLPICSTLIRTTVSRHSHCYAHCLVISESEIHQCSIQLSTDIVIVMHTVMRLKLPLWLPLIHKMWLVIPRFDTDLYNCPPPFNLSWAPSCN